MPSMAPMEAATSVLHGKWGKTFRWGRAGATRKNVRQRCQTIHPFPFRREKTTMARAKGSKNRDYPPLTLEEALKVAEAIADKASGMPVSRLTLSGLLNTTPSSSSFTQAVASSRAFGLTHGGINADEFALTDLGRRATGADE